MLINSSDYGLFFKFIDTYTPVGFKSVGYNDPLIVELEKMMEASNQFFYVADLIQMKILFTSKRSKQLIGVEPEDLTPYHFFIATHPDDLSRLSLGRSQLFKLANELFEAEKGSLLFSTNIRTKNPDGNYTNLLFQMYLFYSTIPYKSIYLLKIHSNIDWYKKRKSGFHYYLGNDLTNFRPPDEELLMLGLPFSARELQIIKLIESGLSSENISEKIFLSLHTVNTHRKNILAKAGRESMPEVIYNLTQVSGLKIEPN